MEKTLNRPILPVSHKKRTIFVIWLGWALVMVGYQAYVMARFTVRPPDSSLSWTGSYTQPDSPTLTEPFLNDHVAWDSEYYLSIAIGGYHDPAMRAIPENYSWNNPEVALQGQEPKWVSMNYAFFPFYPIMIRLLAYPLRVIGLNQIATATLAGVLVSMLGTLGAMFALYDMMRDEAGESDGVRAAFYLLIFPAAMFLAQVYTEGLFLGLSFGALALLRRKHWAWAAILAACATWTRAAGGLLALPLGLYWLKDGGIKNIFSRLWWKELLKLIVIASPVWAYLIFNAVMGRSFHIIETNFYSRGLLLIHQSWGAWKDAYLRMMSSNLQARAYFLVEFGAIIFGLVASFVMLKREPILAVYSLLTIFFSLTSGGAQGMHRYVMAAPVIFLLPARWGKSEAFDRIWTLSNILLMGVFAIMFSFNFWAG
jgi:Gpi18-like mannosyltransferase